MFEKANETYFTLLIILIIVLLFFIAFTAILISLFRKNRLLFIEKMSSEYISRGEERRRISKDLHDEFGALLSSTKMYMSSLNSSNFDQEILMKSISSVSQGLDTLNRITNNLYPSALNKNNINEAILDLIHEHCYRINLIVKTNLDEVLLDDFFDNRSKVQLYWILKEIIINTIKHAFANKISINFNIINHFLIITIKDNGIGFDININKNNGNGITNITNRVEILNGSVEVESEVKNGVKYQIKIPIRNEY